jgi:glucose-6-phosphate-specific signal transduction histidine kinase
MARGAARSRPALLQRARVELHDRTLFLLRNAVRHAEAKRVEVEIRYGKEQFRLRVRDDGSRFDTAILAAGAVRVTTVCLACGNATVTEVG